MGFVFVYLLTMVVVLVAWHLHPTFSLGAFLALTYYHFSTGDALATPRMPHGLRVSEWVARGGVVLSFPAQFHRHEFQPLLGHRAPENGVRLLLHGLAAYAPIVGIAAAFCLLGSFRAYIQHRQTTDLARGVEIALLAVLFALLPALVAFTIHFRLLHSMRHMLRVATRTSAGSAMALWGRMLRVSLPLSLATLVLGAGAYTLISGWSFDAANLMRVIFIGIASMTYPHVVVVSLFLHAGRGDRAYDDGQKRLAHGDQPATRGSVP